MPSTQGLALSSEKRRDDKTVLLGFAVDYHQIFSWFDLPDRKQFASIVGIELGRTHLRWRVSSPALSIAGWVHNSTIAMFPKAPRVIPDGGLSPVRLATMAVPWQPSRHRGGSSARPHPPLTTRFTPRLVDALPLSTLLRLSVR